MKTCKVCGSSNDDKYLYCTKCGNLLPVEEVICTDSVDLENVPANTSEPVLETSTETAPETVPEAAPEVAAEPEVCPACQESAPSEANVVAPVAAVTEETVVEPAEQTAAEAVAEPAVEQEAEETDTKPLYDVMPEFGKGKCTAGLALGFGFVSFFLFWIPGLNIVMFVLSILGIIAANAAKKHYNYGAANAGKVLCIFALVLNIILTALFVLAIFMKYNDLTSLLTLLKDYVNQATSMITDVGKFLGSVFLVK